ATKKIAADEKHRGKSDIGVDKLAMSQHVGIETINTKRRHSRLEAKQFFAPAVDEESQEDSQNDHLELRVKENGLGLITHEERLRGGSNGVQGIGAVLRDQIPVCAGLTGILKIEG